MALKANGALLDWREYEFGVDPLDGNEPTVAPDYATANAAARLYGGQPVFRAVYHTKWMDCTE